MSPRLAAALAVVLALASSAHAAPVVAERDAQRDLALTVYQHDLGLVRDTREVRLGDGVVSLRFRDVPSGIDPTSVVLRAVPDPGAVSVLEQRYAFDRLTPDALLARFVGREVQLRMDGGLVRARLLGVAGDPNRAARGPVPLGTVRERLASAAEAGVPREEVFAEYHLYRVDGPTTLAENETTQIRLVEAPRMAVARRLVYEGSHGIWQPRARPGARDPGFREGPVSAVLEIENSDAKGLGRPLPGGIVRVLAPDASGALRLAGEDVIDHTPTGERRVLRLGAAFDLVAARRQVEWARIDDRTNEVEWEIRVRNRSGVNETVQVIESIPGDWRLLRSSLPARKVDATTIRFDVPVPAGGETTLAYRVRSRW